MKTFYVIALTIMILAVGFLPEIITVGIRSLASVIMFCTLAIIQTRKD